LAVALITAYELLMRQVRHAAALPIRSAADRIRAHQRFGEGLHHRAQQIRARLRQLLFQPALARPHALRKVRRCDNP
jgi:hypothetical protein